MPVPTPSFTKLMLLSSAALWSSILAGLRYGGTYRNHILGSVLFELEDNALAIGSQGRIEFTTGDMAIGSNEIEGVPTAVSRYGFILKPGDSLAYDNFTRCVFEATQIQYPDPSRSIWSIMHKHPTPYVLIDNDIEFATFGQEADEPCRRIKERRKAGRGTAVPFEVAVPPCYDVDVVRE
ncbi:hypothetical protein FOL46_003520 [Perkinsus olseni]|uniref:Uncharacterized protein n=1 Tax=Perkinsus olseni TaxID=32597 RepID=A0A7J6M3D9_PEROL|nr:hypothetical protein FOL46_003520 [Perkinsus olseni]